MSSTRKQRKAAANTPARAGSAKRATSLPTTSSITMNDGSRRRASRSARPDAATPSAKSAPTRPRYHHGLRTRAAAAPAASPTTLPAVPGAHGTAPTPPAVATSHAHRARTASDPSKRRPILSPGPEGVKIGAADGHGKAVAPRNTIYRHEMPVSRPRSIGSGLPQFFRR